MSDWETMQPATATPPQTATPGGPVLIPNSPEWIAERDKRLLAWQAAKEALAVAKEGEMSLRTAAASFMLPEDQRKSGVNNVELGNGYVAKLTHKINYNIVGANEAVETVQDEIEKVGNEGAFLADRLIKWTPELSLTEYKALDMANPSHVKIKALVDTVLETKSGAPTLEIKEPKASLNG